MKLNIHDIEDEPKALAYDEATGPLNAVLVHGAVCDFEFRDPAAVHLNFYRGGEDLFFHGQIAAQVIGHCARCLEEYPFLLATEFSTVMVPRPSQARPVEAEDDVDVAYYESEEVDLSPLVQERIILALPTRPLCSEVCKGLCPQCGTNLNTDPCTCSVHDADSRLALLRSLKLAR